MALNEMISTVIVRLVANGETIESKYYTNGMRNFIIITDKAGYLLKWNDAPFMAAGRLVRGIKGIGETVNFESYHYEFTDKYAYIQDKKILFEWTATHGEIYYLEIEDFTMKSKTYIQKNNEKELVISVADLKRWE
jgi:hypothetical protein